jgi:subtilisin-like proprotein convertase family protein
LVRNFYTFDFKSKQYFKLHCFDLIYSSNNNLLMLLKFGRATRLNQFKIVISFVLFTCLTHFSPVVAQLVTFTGTGNLPIPPGAPAQTQGVTQSPNTVTGVGTIGGCVTIDNVQININHQWDGDIGILLIGPGGQVLDLSTGNGSSGDNFTNTIFTDNTSPFITSGMPPYTGTFRPEGRTTSLTTPYTNAPALGTHTFANTYNGTNADGVWILYVNDFFAADIGEILSWSITFNIGGAAPIANAGPDVTICAGQTTTLTATGGGTYQWSNGSTGASISVAPNSATTYTVTVTVAGCGGSGTDEVVVTTRPKPTVTFTAVNTAVCASGCLNLTATFTGTPPFLLTYSTTDSNGSQLLFGETFNSFSQQFQICVPSDAAVGGFVVAAVLLSDSFCTCQ